MRKRFTLILLLFFSFALAASAQSGNNIGHPGAAADDPVKVVKVYPNPATTKVTFEIQHNNDVSFEIIVYNFLGKKIDILKNISSSYTLDLDKYYSGIYIYQLRDNRGNLVESGKFNVIKQ